MIRIGAAGWQIPRSVRERFPEAGSTLQRYAARFPFVEVNSTFYRPHRPATFARWAADTPEGFRFAVKLARTITHEKRLAGAQAELDAFLGQLAPLAEKLGPLLVQLPPKLAFDPVVADAFFAGLRARFAGDVACEPRHPSWFTDEAEAMLAAHRIARVAADPACVPAAAEPGGWRGFAYWRWHGSPRMYWSAYGPERIAALAAAVADSAWVVFDNTGSGAAAADALTLQALISSPAGARSGASAGP